MKTIQCACCGDETNVRIDSERIGKFCSTQCAGVAKRNRYLFKCAFCKTSFESIGHPKYCSFQCLQNSRKQKRETKINNKKQGVCRKCDCIFNRPNKRVKICNACPKKGKQWTECKYCKIYSWMDKEDKFCSRQCATSSIRLSPKLTNCRTCETPMNGRPGQKFCSLKCSRKLQNRMYSKKTPLPCFQCGLPCTKTNTKFCSQQCSAKSTRRYATETERRVLRRPHLRKLQNKYNSIPYKIDSLLRQAAQLELEIDSGHQGTKP